MTTYEMMKTTVCNDSKDEKNKKKKVNLKQMNILKPGSCGTSYRVYV